MNPSVLALKGGSFIGDSETQMQEGSGNGVSLSAQCLEPGQGAPALCTLMLNFNLLTSLILLVIDRIPV